MSMPPTETVDSTLPEDTPIFGDKSGNGDGLAEVRSELYQTFQKVCGQKLPKFGFLDLAEDSQSLQSALNGVGAQIQSDGMQYASDDKASELEKELKASLKQEGKFDLRTSMVGMLWAKHMKQFPELKRGYVE